VAIRRYPRQVRLTSTDGAVVELRPTGYQFPGTVAEGPDDWDANWLLIAGQVRLSDGRSWAFTDPCLTTWEAQSLGGWLQDVVSGVVAPTPFSGTGDEVLQLFTEPNLAFSLAERTGSHATVRIHFSLESSPPWLADEGDMFDFFVAVEMPLAGLDAASAMWTEELAEFPEL
jgi:hypothetical protein